LDSTVKAIELKELWRRYKSADDERARERLVVAYAPLVKYVVGRMRSNLPGHIDEAELTSYGLGGLVGAISRFDPDREIKFETYAITRIRGAIVDELRTMDWVPRSVRARAREIERANRKLEAQLQRVPTDEEMAGELQLSVEEFQDRLLRIYNSNLVALDEMWYAGDGNGDQASLLETLPDSRAADPETGRGLSEEDVRANIVTFIGAGHETTANALTWTLYLLSQSPEWRARVEAEIDVHFDPDDETDPTERLPVTKAVFEEAMRLFPPAANLVREAISEDWIAGFRIPAGTIVSVSPYVLHRHKTLWRNPEDFDPSRFLPGEREKIDRYAYIPFGAGPRVCIGQAFAMQEGVIVLAHFLKRIRLDLFPGHPVALQQRITLRPRHGMRMIVRRR